MFRVNVGGHTYEISFTHDIESYCGALVRLTEAVIRKSPEGDPRDGSVYEVFGGTAVCHPKDNFCKATGRKLALGRAVQQFSKAVRSAIWRAYWKTQGKNFSPASE